MQAAWSDSALSRATFLPLRRASSQRVPKTVRADAPSAATKTSQPELTALRYDTKHQGDAEADPLPPLTDKNKATEGGVPFYGRDMTPSSPHCNVYIDGFNFYKGCVAGTQFKWLDLRALAETLMRSTSIQTVNYFTARVKDRPEDPGQSQRQDTYLRALESVNGLAIHYGHFRTRTKRVYIKKPQPDGSHFATAKVTEEKATDVKLASRLVWDACHDDMACALVISNDSDFQESIDLARKRSIKVVLVNPHYHSGQQDHLAGDDVRRLRKGHLAGCQLPELVWLPDGTSVCRPAAWA
jgi:uncharacterized LabA/DUF88 family protein